MFSVARLSSYVATSLFLSGVTLVASQDSTFPATPHASKFFPTPTDLPYKVDTDTNLIRGVQHGYNICNSTTENQDSLCQTSYFNSIEDFCLWGPPEYGEEVGNIEGIMVAYCTERGHGTRLIPAGALRGVQFITAPDYVQAVGFIDQVAINILEDDWGGEMDPHGADLRGNPMGGVVYSNAFTGEARQVIEWHNFIGGMRFCFKACDPAGQDDDKYCEHIFDRIGCDYNIIGAPQEGVFEHCQADNMEFFPGTYRGEDGQTSTYTQPTGVIGPNIYPIATPSSSECTTYASTDLYPDLPAPTRTSGGLAGATTTTGSTSSPTTTTSPTRTNTDAAATSSPTSGAASNAVSMTLLVGVSFFFALTFA